MTPRCPRCQVPLLDGRCSGRCFDWPDTRPPMLTIFTLGYGNRQPADTYAMVPPWGLLVDVRSEPVGWTPAYSLPTLVRRYPERYRWREALGNTLVEGVDPHMIWTPQGEDGMVQGLLAIMADEVCQHGMITLWCAEKDAQTCHRRSIAEYVEDALWRTLREIAQIIHLTEADHDQERHRHVSDPAYATGEGR